MPPNVRAQPIDLPLPIKGIDQSMPYSQQPPLTVPDLMNVRALDSRDRLGIGKRDGTAKAFNAAINGTNSETRVTGLSTINDGLSIPGGSLGVETAIDDNFDSYSVASPADLGNGYVTARVRSSLSAVLAYNSHNIVNVSGSDDCLQFTDQFTAGNNFDWTVFAINFYCVQDVTLNIRCNGQAQNSLGSHPNATHGPNDGMSGCGPAIRMSNSLRTFVQARVCVTTDDNVQLQIVTVNNNTVTVVGSNTAFALSGTATITDDLQIRIYESGSNIVAELLWPSQGISSTQSLTVTTSFNEGEMRAGWASVCQTVSGGAGTSNPGRRNVTRVRATKYVPADYLVYRTISGSDNYFGTGYTVPSGWTAVYRSNAATPIFTTQAGSNNAAADPTYPAIDEANNVLRGTASAAASSTPTTCQFFTETTDSVANTRLGVDCVNTNVGSAGFSSATPVFRMSSDLQNFLVYSINKTNNTSTNLCRYIAGGAQANMIQGTSETNLATFSSGDTLEDVVFYITDRLRWTDDGTTVRLYVNGMLLWAHTPSGAGALTGTKCGISLGDPDNSTSNVPTISSARIVQGEGNTAADLSEAKSLIVASLYDRNWVGDLKAGSIQECSGGGFLNPIVQWTSFARKFYGVDGSRAKQVNPDTLTTSDYASLVTAGTLPTQCRLICTYRGRIVLARQPNNLGIYYMSRTFNPFDWDYAASPISTAAVTGSNADVGQPADAITALIPFSDDYLIFGGASTVWMMEGDPGYGGKVQNLSYQTGILGPRAYCFDENGNLYFVGSNGLYRIVRGTMEIQLVSGRRLPTYLDRVDVSTTLVQCVYDSFKGYVHILLTPTDGTTVGTHVVYDVRTDGFFLDQYPLQHGPWSCTQIVGSDDDDRRFVYGCNDGYIRRPRTGVFSDDGTSISTRVRFGPILADSQNLESLATEFQIFGRTSNAQLSWYWLRGESAADVALLSASVGDAAASGAVFASGTSGFNRPIRIRVRGGAHALIFGHNTASDSWAMEGLRVYLAPAGRRRLG